MGYLKSATGARPLADAVGSHSRTAAALLRPGRVQATPLVTAVVFEILLGDLGGCRRP